MGILLLHPPVAKACEPPAGLARLAGALRAAGVECALADLNLELQLKLFSAPPSEMEGTWTRRAVKNASRDVEALRSWTTYTRPGRYSTAVSHLERILSVHAKPARMDLADYEDPCGSAHSSGDLMRLAGCPGLLALSNPLRELLVGHMERIRPDWVGISCNYLHQVQPTFALAGLVRSLFPGVKLVLGGSMVSSWAGRPGWSAPFEGLFDRVVAGEGEIPLLELMGAKVLGGVCEPTLDGMPLGCYLSPGTILPLSLSAGCFWNRCAFCSERTEGRPYRPLPARDAAVLARRQTETWRPSLIHFLDNALSPVVLSALAGNPPGAPWYGFARVTPELTDEGFCRDLARSGCVMLQLGVESGDAAVLEAMGKGITPELASAALRALGRAGVGTYVYLLFGTPWETPEAARRTRDFALAHAGEIGFLNLSVFNLPRGCDQGAGLDLLPDYKGDLALYETFAHPDGWNRGDVRRFLEGEFRRNPLLAPILRRTPPTFTSNHAPLFLLGGSPI